MTERLEFITFIEADGGTMECPTMTTIEQAAKALPELVENYAVEYATRIIFEDGVWNIEDVSDEVFATALDNAWDYAKDNRGEDTVRDYFIHITSDYAGRLYRMCWEAM